jgi:DNA invertase Pin-like site-specific DNA recombinase
MMVHYLTEDQNPDLQLTALKRTGCGKIFTDKATDTNTKRPALEKCLKALNAGDVLTVWKLDRLGRSLRDLIALLDDLKAKGVAFRSLTGNAHGPRHVANGRHSRGA